MMCINDLFTLQDNFAKLPSDKTLSHVLQPVWLKFIQYGERIGMDLNYTIAENYFKEDKWN